MVKRGSNIYPPKQKRLTKKTQYLVYTCHITNFNIKFISASNHTKQKISLLPSRRTRLICSKG